MSNLKAAVDSLLEKHQIRGGVLDKSLREMNRDELLQTFLEKSDDVAYRNQILKQNELWLEDKDFVQDAIRTKEAYFDQRFNELSEGISKIPALQKFGFDFSEMPRHGSTELFYNEAIRQVRNFADRELETPNRLLREKIRNIDSHFSFNRFNHLPWAQQNPLLEQELINLQETALDVHNMIGEVKAFWPNFDAKARLVGKPLEAQYRSLSQTLENNRAYVQAKEDFAKFADSLPESEFRSRLQDEPFRRAYRQATGTSVIKLDGQYYRQSEYDDMIERSNAEAVAAEKERLASIEQKRVSPEVQEFLSANREAVEAERVAAAAEREKPVSDKVVYIDPTGKRQYFDRSELDNLDPAIKAKIESQEKLRADIEQYNNIKQVRAKSAANPPAIDPEVGEELVAVKPHRVVHGSGMSGIFNSKTEETVADSVSKQTPSVSESVNQITKDTVQQKTIGESESSRIEREAVERTYNLRRQISNSQSSGLNLSADTARSYVFGYKQKALLGFMGTAGAVSLLEASMSGPNQEAIERRRRLEEERCKKQFGY